MIIDRAIKTFVEKYDREAMSYISEISQNLGLVHNKYTIKGFNITESFDKFQEYIKGYAQYKIENANNAEASPQNVIIESVRNFIDTQIFQEKDMLYNELPAFVEEYVNGVNNLLKTIDEVKEDMMESGVDQNDIGDVNDFTDSFMIKLHESFDPTMDRILRASGYTTKKNLYANTPKEKPHIFL